MEPLNEHFVLSTMQAHLSLGFDVLLFNSERQLDRLISDLRINYPKYAKLKNESVVVNIASIQNGLSEGEVLIGYHNGINFLTAFVMSKREMKIVQICVLHLSIN